MRGHIDKVFFRVPTGHLPHILLEALSLPWPSTRYPELLQSVHWDKSCIDPPTQCLLDQWRRPQIKKRTFSWMGDCNYESHFTSVSHVPAVLVLWDKTTTQHEHELQHNVQCCNTNIKKVQSRADLYALKLEFILGEMYSIVVLQNFWMRSLFCWWRRRNWGIF